MGEEFTGMIDDWSFSDGMIWGKITGDTKRRFPDGSYIHTSKIMSETSNLKEGDIVHTLNSSYKLGYPAKEQEEEKKEEPVKEAKLVLPCGHEDCFEHSFTEGILLLVHMGMARRTDPTEEVMQFVRQVFERFCIPIPTNEQIKQLAMNDHIKNTEVH